MSDEVQQNESTSRPNGPTRTKKRKIATTSVKGSKFTVNFTPEAGGGAIEFDAASIPGAEKTTGAALTILAYGALAIVQTSYSNSDEPMVAAQNALRKLTDGSWTPGVTRRPSEPDPLVQALSEHLKRPVDDSYFERYAKHAGLKNAAAARRELRAHPDVAPIVARIVSERAKAVAAQAKGQPRKSLDI